MSSSMGVGVCGLLVEVKCVVSKLSVGLIGFES